MIPKGPCEMCVAGKAEIIPQEWGPFEPAYADSIPDARIPGITPSECGYRPQLLCMVHASERRHINTSRVEPVLYCESEQAYRIDGGRAGGDCVCGQCRRTYYRHPAHKDYPFLVQLCDGVLVKL